MNDGIRHPDDKPILLLTSGTTEVSIQSEILVNACLPDLTESQDPELVKCGSVLQNDDVSLRRKNERDLFLPIFASSYGRQFVPDCIQSCDSISFTSRKVILTDDEGNRYFLKEKPQYCCTDSRLRSAAMFQNYLSKEMRTVSEIVKTVDGNDYVSFNTRKFFLTPYSEGNLYFGRVAQSVSCAVSLAELHKNSLSFELAPTEIVESSEINRMFMSWVSKIEWPAQDLFVATKEELTKIIEAHNIPPHETGRYCWTHGDFAPFNVTFDSDEVKSIHDFDNCAYAPMVRDIAIMLLTHCCVYYQGTSSSLNEPIQEFVDTDRMSKMLEAYCSHNPLTSDELSRIPDHLNQHWVELMCLGLVRGDFSLRSVYNALDFPRKLTEASTSVVDRFLKNKEGTH